jgi:2',3'-cyclic-nucleotide 2'-phosphodiesterase/3'-nucleotidase
MLRRLGFALVAIIAASPGFERTVTLRFLATTDLHGNIYPYDYYAARPAARGLAKISTLIARERAAQPNTLLLDCGDTIQGSPLEGVHQASIRSGGKDADPMMLAMNRLGYDAMAVGNHEFNYGRKNFEAARKDAKFPWLSANAVGWPAVQPYVIKTIAGVRVAVIGVTTPTVPAWEKEENYRGLRFTDPAQGVASVIRSIGSNADVFLVIAHTGLDRDPKTGNLYNQDLAGENAAYQIAKVTGVDAVFFGHTHSELPEYRAGDVLMVQPRNWGMSLGEMDFEMQHVDGRWKIAKKSSRVIPVTDATGTDPAILAIAKPYHEAAEEYLAKAVADAPKELSAALGRVEDTALIDAIQETQLAETGADVSFASAFNLGVRVPQGRATVRQIAALYPYENTLYTIEGTGKMVRAALENSARYYKTCATDCRQGPLINSEVIGFNYDMAEGVDYEIDLRKPAGQRIVNLRFQGKPLADDQLLKIAVNSYRAGGSGGYTMFRGAKVIWRSTEEVREMMVRHFSSKGALPSDADHNWRVIPPEALEELEREARRESARPQTQ